jgi:hypothetical protein
VAELRRLYAAVEADLTPALVPPALATWLGATLTALPIGGAETFGFELRLAGGDERADLGIGLSLASGGPEALATPAQQPALARAIAADERWLRLHRFGRRWAAESEWQMRVPFVFLELDCDAPESPLPVPSVFLGLDWPTNEMTAEARRPGREQSHDRTPGLATAREMLTLLRRDPVPPAVDALLARCFALVPDGGLVLHLAVMLGRASEAVRLSLLLPRTQLFAYLSAIGWAEGLPALERLIRLLAPVTDLAGGRVQIDLDLGNGLGSAAGLMLQPHPGRGWIALFEALVDDDLCEPGRRDAVLAWPGISSLPAMASTGGPTHLERHIAHAKITCGAGVETRAKAYLGVRWR